MSKQGDNVKILNICKPAGVGGLFYFNQAEER
jgi:hypothetical protein